MNNETFPKVFHEVDWHFTIVFANFLFCDRKKEKLHKTFQGNENKKIKAND